MITRKNKKQTKFGNVSERQRDKRQDAVKSKHYTTELWILMKKNKKPLTFDNLKKDDISLVPPSLTVL